jgi:hypothetical protein
VGDGESTDEASVRSGDDMGESESSTDFFEPTDEADDVEAWRRVGFGRSGALYESMFVVERSSTGGEIRFLLIAWPGFRLAPSGMSDGRLALLVIARARDIAYFQLRKLRC